jgi:hypothetical protein
MKLFNQLLVAPAALGLLAPVSAIASEVNISEIASYSDIEQVEEEIFDHNSFTNSLASTTSTQSKYSSPASFEAGGFSDTTVATQSAQFLIGAADGDATLDEEAVQAYYYYSLSLDTSFTGEDNLNVGIETGNTNASGGFNTGTVLDFGSSAGDTLKVVDINYTKSFGDLSVTVGDSLDASSQFAGACAYAGFTDHLADCGTGLSAGLGGDVSLSSSYDFGNGLVAGFGLTGQEASTTDGLLTKESIDAYALQLAYAADSYGLALTYSDIDSHAGGSGVGLTEQDTTLWGVNGYYTFGGAIENLSVGYEMGNPDTGNDTTNWFAGVTTAEVGPGSISLGLGTSGHIAEDAEDTLQYEASYSWDINDATSMTVGGFISERTASAGEDLTGIALSTTFSF